MVAGVRKSADQSGRLMQSRRGRHSYKTPDLRPAVGAAQQWGRYTFLPRFIQTARRASGSSIG